MGDVTDGCTVKSQGSLMGLNYIIIQTAADVDDGDTIEVNELLVGGAAVGKIQYATATQDPTGTAVTDPMIWADDSDTLTIGGSTDNKRRDIFVLYE